MHPFARQPHVIGTLSSTSSWILLRLSKKSPACLAGNEKIELCIWKNSTNFFFSSAWFFFLSSSCVLGRIGYIWITQPSWQEVACFFTRAGKIREEQNWSRRKNWCDDKILKHTQISDWLLFQQILHNIFGERDIFSGVCSYFGDECALIMHRVHIRIANRWIGTNASDAQGSIRRTEVLIWSQKWWWLPLAIKGSSTLVKPFFAHGNPSSFMETSFAHEGAGEEREVLNDYLWQQCKFECEKH